MATRRGKGTKGSSKKKRDETMRGLVLSVMGRGYKVDIGGDIWICRPRGRLFLGEKSTRPVVGDWVQVQARKEALTGVINEIEPRRSALARRSSETGREQVLAANIDQVLVCVAIKDPPFRAGLIDRYLITCEALTLEPTIIINKIDLATEQEIHDASQEFRDIGYKVLETSAEKGIGIAPLKAIIQGRNSVFTGPSGAGKSSLTNAIQPGVRLSTGDVNTVTGRGRHTTTVSQLIGLADGFIMDTPGIREFAPWGMQLEALPGAFVEFREHLNHCQFRDCQHRAEPICGVKQALADGKISARRYQSFLQLYEEIADETRPQY